ncbi:MAG: hypothetical protein V1720_05720 [bacterium]
MNCKKALDIIYLKDEIEITNQMKSDFDGHLKECAFCREEFQNAKSYFRVAEKMRDYEPALENHSEFTNGVMQAVKSERIQRQGLFVMIENFIYKPFVRIAFSAVIIFFTVLFFSQEFEAMKKINRLENKYSHLSVMIDGKEEQFSNATSFAPLYELYKLFDSEIEYIDLPADWTLIKKSEIRKLLAEYGRYIENKSNINLIDKSELLSLLENTDRTEMQRIIENKDNILTKLYPVFPGGEHKNEK